MDKSIAILPGDGIGPEIMREALRVLRVVEKNYGHEFKIAEGLIGGAAYDEHGVHFPDVTRDICRKSDAILFGAVGGPAGEQHLDKWKNCEANSLLALRKEFSFNANFRPVRVFSELADISPLKQSTLKDGIDLLVVRELLGDIYFGEHKTEMIDGKRVATDVAVYTEDQIRSIAHRGFSAAQKRQKKITSVDKANVLDTSKLWRSVVRDVSRDYPDVALQDMLVDNCAMQLIINPKQFDVILTANLFGDILSDAAAVLPGSLGLLASASLSEDGFGFYEPPGGSAPDIAGLGVANPIGQILSMSMMLRWSFGLSEEASAIEAAVSSALDAGYRTTDIAQSEESVIKTSEMADAIISFL